MKRFLVVALTLALLVGILPVAAQSAGDLTTLAQYLPDSAPAYLAFRTDDGFLNDLEALRLRFLSALPAGMADDVDEESLFEALDELAEDLMGNDDAEFATAIRPWLGDTAAVGALSLDSMMDEGDGPFLIAVAITDRAGAEAAFIQAFERQDNDVNIETAESYTLITSSRSRQPAALYLDDQVLLLTNKPEALPLGGPLANSLATSAQFQATLAELPAAGYNLVAYIDYGAFVQASLMQAGQVRGADAELAVAMGPMLDIVNGMAIGLTQLDGRALTADMALGWNPAALDGMLVDMSGFQPVDPAFAAHLPGGTQLVIQGTNLAESFAQGLANLSALAELEASAMGDSEAMDEAQQALIGLRFAVRGITGLDLEDEVLNWMNGQYALSASLDFPTLIAAAMSPQMPVEAIEFSFVIENTTGEGAQALVAGLSDGLTQLLRAGDTDEVTLTEETIGGAPALVIGLDAPNMADTFEIVIGGNADVFVIGTPNSARAALSPDGGLDGDPAYQEAQQWALGGTPALLYASGGFFDQVLGAVMFGMRSASPTTPELAPLFSSSSVSATYSDTAVTMRMVLTLAE